MAKATKAVNVKIKPLSPEQVAKLKANRAELVELRKKTTDEKRLKKIDKAIAKIDRGLEVGFGPAEFMALVALIIQIIKMFKQ